MSRRISVAAAVGVIVFASAAAANAQTVHVFEDRAVDVGLTERSLVEPHLAVHPSDPNHLLGAAIATGPAPTWEDRARAQRCITFVSTDGDVGWTRHDFPVTSCYDPWVAFLPDGRAVFTALGRHPDWPSAGGAALLVYHSDDGGLTWSESPLALGGGHDHQTVIVDDSDPARAGWLYVLSSRDMRADDGRLRFGVFVARSRNGGRSFDPPVHIRPNNLMAKAEMPVVLSDGTLIVSYVEAATPKGDAVLVRRRAFTARSTDGGDTFSRPSFVDETCGPSSQAFSLSSLIADSRSDHYRDRLYFACNVAGGGAVIVRHSADLGESWSPPVMVHEAPADTLIPRKLMGMAVNAAGVLGVVWTDGRNAKGGQECYDTYFAASVDGGATFLPELRISTVTSCPHPARGIPWTDGGDYFGLAADGDDRFRLVWSDWRGSTFQLRTATVDVPRAGDR